MKFKKFKDRIEYYNEKGQLHRIEGPAVHYFDGNDFYYVDGKLHNIKGPAIIWPEDKSQEFYIHGKQLNHLEFRRITK